MVIFLSGINYTFFSAVFQVVMLTMLMVLCYTVCKCVGMDKLTCHRGVITIRSRHLGDNIGFGSAPLSERSLRVKMDDPT